MNKWSLACQLNRSHGNFLARSAVSHVCESANPANIFLAHPSVIGQGFKSMSSPPSFANQDKPSRVRKVSCNVSSMAVPRPITSPSAHNLTVTPPRSFSTCVTPLASPCSSPPPILPSSGSLEMAKKSLANVASLRNTKASVMTIDGEMKDVCQYYSMLGTEERHDFLQHLATEYSVDHTAVQKLTMEAPDFQQGAATGRWSERLRLALEPPHAWLVTQISRLAGGVKFLVDLRQDLIVMQRDLSDEETVAAVKRLDTTLREMLALWFTVGLLQLSRVTWDSSCSMLQKISEYEAVHPVRNWTDLKRRVGPYRRCFVFTHSCMPSEPLVVLHTFLTDGISGDMVDIVRHHRFGHASPEPEAGLAVDPGQEDSAQISAAVFYSITSTQGGLRGIELGNYLIKRVVQELMAELPGVTQFSSLSPIPGYVDWLQSLIVKALRGEAELFTPEEFVSISSALSDDVSDASSDDVPVTYKEETSSLDVTADDLNAIVDEQRTFVYNRVKKLLATNTLLADPERKVLFKEPLMRLCAFYLYNEKRRGYALNSVAHFHLKNGATLWRLNYEADVSPRGLSNSCGMMVNYRYFLREAETNSRSYQEDQNIPADPDIVARAAVARTMLWPGQSAVGADMPVIKLSEV